MKYSENTSEHKRFLVCLPAAKTKSFDALSPKTNWAPAIVAVTMLFWP